MSAAVRLCGRQPCRVYKILRMGNNIFPKNSYLYQQKQNTSMGFFTPYKKHANRFNYVPRYYDPEKEAREQRRAELRGERAEDGEREYQPGQYIRTQREARAARRRSSDDQGRTRVLKMVVAAVLMLLFIYLLYPRLADAVLRARQGRVAPDVEKQFEEFNPYAPIVVVPNDYQEGDEIPEHYE